MRTIYKYPVVINDEFEIELPIDAKILSVDNQGSQGAQMWVLLNPDFEKIVRKFRLFGTGHPVPENLSFIGTF